MLSAAAAFALSLAASPSFPSTVQQQLQLNSTPSCTLCHATAAGGSGTATKPFAAALIGQGLLAEDNASLTQALDALDAAGTDSDGDGTGDIDELHAGTDPNVAGAAGSGTIDPVQYGFGCSAFPVEVAAGAGPLALLALLVGFRRRKGAGVGAGVAAALLLGVGGCTFPGGIGSNGQVIPPGFSDTPADALCGSGLTWTRGNHESANMHPGLDCISCHRGGEGPRFAIAGTVMTDMHDEDDCLGVGGVTVELIDANGVSHTLDSNDAGNFYARSSIPLPYTARLTRDGRTAEMVTPQTELNCMKCHTAAGASGAPGRIIAP